MDKAEKEILIVNGNEDEALQLKKILERSGYASKIERNGAECLKAVNKSRPALILCDVGTPGIDGYEMCRRLKNDTATRDIPVILLSQLSEAHDVIRGLESGADNYVTKPFSEDYLLQKIGLLIKGSNVLVNDEEEKCARFNYGGREYDLRAGRRQTLNFLLSIYENAIVKNKELTAAHDELRNLNENLEGKVRERTSALNNLMIERKTVEDALKESEERFRAVVESASDAVICIEPPGIVYLWNRKSEEMFGYSAGEMLGKNLHDYITPERYRKAANEALSEFFKTGKGKIVGKSVVLEAVRKSGEEFPIELSISALNMRGVWASVGIIRDITERKRLEDELKDKLHDLERMNKLMVGRELKMEELRAEIRELRKKVDENESKKKAFLS